MTYVIQPFRCQEVVERRVLTKRKSSEHIQECDDDRHWILPRTFRITVVNKSIQFYRV